MEKEDEISIKVISTRFLGFGVNTWQVKTGVGIVSLMGRDAIRKGDCGSLMVITCPMRWKKREVKNLRGSRPHVRNLEWKYSWKITWIVVLEIYSSYFLSS